MQYTYVIIHVQGVIITKSNIKFHHHTSDYQRQNPDVKLESYIQAELSQMPILMITMFITLRFPLSFHLSPCLEVVIATFGYIHSKGSFLFHEAFTRSGSSVRHLRQFYIIYGLQICSSMPQVQGWKTHKTTSTRVSWLKLLVGPFPLHCNLAGPVLRLVWLNVGLHFCTDICDLNQT